MPGPETQSTEEQLRAEINELRRRLEQHPHGSHDSHGSKKKPTAGVLWGLAIAGAVVVVAAFFGGYLPQSQRQTALAKEAKDDSAALPIVNVVPVQRSSSKSE